MSGGTLRVALVDDEPLVRAGVRAILSSSPGLEVVAEGADGRAAVELARAHRLHVLVMDLAMPGTDGVAATAEIRRLGLDVPLLILTTFGTDENLRRCLAAGADGFLLKASAPAELIAGVRAVAEGGAVIAPVLARHLLERLRGDVAEPEAPGLESLSPRDREVLALLSRGLSNAEIGGRLHLTEGTVKGYVSRILLGLGVENRVQAALIGYRAGLTRDRP